MESRVGTAVVSPGGKKLNDRSPSQPKHSTPIKDYVKPVRTPLSRTKSEKYSSRLKDDSFRHTQDSNSIAMQSSLSKKSRRHDNADKRTPESPLSAVRSQLANSLANCDDLTDSVLSNGIPSELQMKLTEFENTTILKQRQELQLLVSELKDRDRELNEIVATHQRQMASWEKDRQKIANLEDNLDRLQNELQNRNHDYRAIVAKLRTVESEEMNKSTALNNTQEQLAVVTEQHSQTSTQLLELEGSKRALNSKIQDLSSTLGKLEAREEELITVLKLKDRDLSEASSHIAELNVKLKVLDGHLQDGRDSQVALKRKGSAWKNKAEESAREADRLKREILRFESACDEYKLDIHKLKQDLSTTKKEVILANEREKRKDQLLQLQKSKQDRTDSELSNLRRLYERQQMDLSMLHSNLESTKELLKKTSLGRSLESSLLSSLSLNSSETYSPAPQRSHRTISPPRHIPYRSTSPGSLLRRNRSKSPGTSAAQVYDDQSLRSRAKSPRSYIDRTRSRSPSLEDPPEKTRDEASRYDSYSSPYQSYRYYASRAFDGEDWRRDRFDVQEKKDEEQERGQHACRVVEPVAKVEAVVEVNNKREISRGVCSASEETEPAIEPALEPTLEPTLEPAHEPELEPAHEPELEPALEPALEPVLEPAHEPAKDLASPQPSFTSKHSETANSQAEVDQVFAFQNVEELDDVSIELSSQGSSSTKDDSPPRQTDSPATKLHKLLVESCDMVQDLEQSTASSTVDESQTPPERDIPSAVSQVEVESVSDSDC